MSLLNLFGGLRRLLRRRTVSIDNCVFRLHWLVTSLVLVTFSLLITARQYVGEPIECVPPSDDFPMSVLNTYCWIHSTFTIPSAFVKKVGVEVAHPGVDNSGSWFQDKRYTAYYQWNWEGGLLEVITMGMQVVIMEDQERTHKTSILTEYLFRNLKKHQVYALKYMFCEFLSFVNVIGQMFLIDRFLGGEFWSYGIEVIRFSQSDQEDRWDPMVFVFPRVTKCTFHTFGTSGDIQRHDALCLLPLNVVNEKIYIFIWFWFIVLVVLSSVVFLMRSLVLAVPRLRFYFLKNRCPLVEPADLEVLTRTANAGDWFLFYMLAKNIDPLVYRDVMCNLAKMIERRLSENGVALNQL
ncbi:innexin shaking-B-like isoform X2 [Ornithodoros turicata]|uniref:innexin shaking-B-like isoform X2 n=1 Tax=Ornithodoros turicata TaxID=34597 RepID=UPI0031389EBF